MDNKNIYRAVDIAPEHIYIYIYEVCSSLTYISKSKSRVYQYLKKEVFNLLPSHDIIHWNNSTRKEVDVAPIPGKVVLVGDTFYQRFPHIIIIFFIF